MTAAAFDLINNNAKVIDVALKYGYESPTAFNRAFRSIHNISPSQAKKEGNCLTSFPRITFSMQIKGEEAMNFKIEFSMPKPFSPDKASPENFTKTLFFSCIISPYLT